MENIVINLRSGEFINREHIDKALKRLKNKMETEGIMEVVRLKRAHENKATKAQRKAKKLHKSIKFQKSLKSRSW